jgi:hypothetical protein
MLDSTDPAAAHAVVTPPEHTLFLLASKSGTTIEPNSLAAHFRQVLERAGIQQWADHFVAITDEGTALASRARSERFREIFINPSDIGDDIALSCWPGASDAHGPGCRSDEWVVPCFGRGLGEPAQTIQRTSARGGRRLQAGRDKMTRSSASSGLRPLDQQLVAEAPDEAWRDRSWRRRPAGIAARRSFFVRMKIGRKSAPLGPADLPLVDIEIPEPPSRRVLRWEIAAPWRRMLP